MYRAHIQHDRIKPAVVTHTAWRDSEEQVRRDVVSIAGGYDLHPSPNWGWTFLTRTGADYGVVYIEQCEGEG